MIWADNIRGPWSDPIDLKIGRIDPGHAVGPDGSRYLFLSGGYVVALAEDGLSVLGEMKKVYDGWKYPDEWVVEGFAQEGPKILRRGDDYYMVLAEGGTAGPPASHMVIAARSKSIEGPWENSPYNAIIRTRSADERWWSKGHATLVEAPGGTWYAVYHAYEVSVEIDIDPGASAGLLLFYNSRLYAGLGYSAANFIMHRYGAERMSARPAHIGRTLFLRLTNDRPIVTIHHSADGKTWERFGTRMEVSGYHHNVMYDFLSLRPAIYAAGTGEVRFRRFTYSALP